MPGHILPPVPISSQHMLDPSIGGEPGHEPPAPPPRPGGPHSRSMSVDYKGNLSICQTIILHILKD